MKDRWLSLLWLLPSVVWFPNDVLAQSVPAADTPTITTALCGRPVCTWNAFGPRLYERRPGGPDKFTETFSVLNVHTRYTLHVEGARHDALTILLNGRVILDQDDPPEGRAPVRHRDRDAREQDQERDHSRIA